MGLVQESILLRSFLVSFPFKEDTTGELLNVSPMETKPLVKGGRGLSKAKSLDPAQRPLVTFDKGAGSPLCQQLALQTVQLLIWQKFRGRFTSKDESLARLCTSF